MDSLAPKTPDDGSRFGRPPEALERESWIRRRARRLIGPGLRRFVDSQDLVQEARLAALRRRARDANGEVEPFASERSLRAWLGVVLRNLAAKAARGRGIVEPFASDATWSRFSGNEASPSAGVLASERRAGVSRLLSELSERDRAIVSARIVDGLAFRDVAERVGVSEAHARVVFSRCIAQLRENPRARELDRP